MKTVNFLNSIYDHLLIGGGPGAREDRAEMEKGEGPGERVGAPDV